MASDYLIKTVKGYENYIERKGIDEQVLDAYREASKVALFNNKDNDGLKISGRARQLYEQFIMNSTGGTSWDLEKYAFENGTYYQILDDFYDLILAEAKNKCVDSYFRYIEKKREPSNTGEVRNRITKNILTPQKDNKGYLRVRMSLHDQKVSAKIHRLVAIAFIPNPENKPQVNHINCNKEDNRAENLEWVTNGENQIHAYKNGLNYVTGRAGRKKIPVIQLDKNGVKIDRYESIGKASRITGIQRQNIEKVIKGQRKTAGGYQWKQESEVMPYAETVNH